MVVKLNYENGKVTSTPCEWKEAVPHPNEPKIICVIIGNSNFKWGILRGKNEDFVPTVFWRYVDKKVGFLPRE
jgi:hypothetical protein